MTYLLKGKYTKLTGEIAVPDNWEDEKGRLTIIADDNEIYMSEIKKGDKAQKVELSLIGIEKLKIRFDFSMAFYNVRMTEINEL